MNTTPADDRLTAFLAWRRRKALEAGLVKPEQVLDEWVFRRILLHEPKDIYALEDLRLLTGPLFHQYGDDLLALCHRRPTEDERPRSSRREDPEPVYRPSTISSRAAAPRPRTHHAEPDLHVSVRRDSPMVTLHAAQSQKRSITDFAVAEPHAEWKGKPFEFKCSTLSFKFWETEFLEHWGALLESIATGETAPETDDEKAVAELTARSRKAAKEWEQAWVKVVLRRAYENI